MSDFNINNPKKLQQTMRKLETTDPAHADLFNTMYQTLLDNDNFLNQLANRMVEKTEVIHNTQIADMNKIPGADVTASLQAQLNEVKDRFQYYEPFMKVTKRIYGWEFDYFPVIINMEEDRLNILRIEKRIGTSRNGGFMSVMFYIYPDEYEGFIKLIYKKHSGVSDYLDNFIADYKLFDKKAILWLRGEADYDVYMNRFMTEEDFKDYYEETTISNEDDEITIKPTGNIRVGLLNKELFPTPRNDEDRWLDLYPGNIE